MTAVIEVDELTKKYGEPTTPAMAAGLVLTPLKFADLRASIDAEDQDQIAERRRATIEAYEKPRQSK